MSTSLFILLYRVCLINLKSYNGGFELGRATNRKTVARTMSTQLVSLDEPKKDLDLFRLEVMSSLQKIEVPPGKSYLWCVCQTI